VVSKAPAGSSEFVQISHLQGGRGVALRQTNPLLVDFNVAPAPVKLGQSPGPGTACTVFLNTLEDAAYKGAQVDFIVMMFGRECIFDSQIITAELLAEQGTLQLTTTGCAADFWEVQITLNNGSQPAVPLQSSILASGVEIAPDSTQASLVFAATGEGPTASGDALFDMPVGSSTWQWSGTWRVTTSGGASEAVGDTVAVTGIATWNNTGGAVRLVPQTTAAPSKSEDASMGGGTPFTPGSTATQAQIAYAAPTGLDAGTVLALSITLRQLGAA
jgi:hypothetical protein